MARITVLYVLMLSTLCTAVSATTPVRGNYWNARLECEVKLPTGVACVKSEPEPGHGCGFNASMRFTELEWRTDSFPSRYTWVSGGVNTGAENTIAVQKAAAVGTAGRVGAVVLRRKSYMASGLSAMEPDISYGAELGEALEKVFILYRVRRGASNVIYTFGLNTPRQNWDDDVRLFHEFVSGFRVR